MKKERIIWIGIVALLLSVILINLNNPYSRADENQEILFKSIFEQAYHSLKSSYVEKIEPKELLKGAINGMIKVLDDPHTAFLAEQQKKNLEIETEGQYGGLGIVIGVRDKRLVVISPMEDTPAERIGIEAGDAIIKIEGEIVKDPDLNEIVKKLRGKPGTKVTITIEREGIDEPMDYTITREKIKLINVKSAVIEDIGYVKLISFSMVATGQLKEVLKKFQKEDKVKAIIFDLRNNSGGLLDIAIEISDYFLEEGLIVYTKPRDDAAHLSSALNKKYYAKPSTTLVSDIPVTVLVNNGTASASEIFAGAVRDNKRGILIGTKTFGKGSVQSVLKFHKDYAMRYTTAYYYTPDGTKIHKKGIEPDIEVPFPRISKEEMDEIKKIRDESLIEDFLKENKNPEEAAVDEFIKNTLAKKAKLDYRLLKRLYKEEYYKINKDQKAPVYDLEYDPQLKMAMQIMQSEISVILKKDQE